jgi:hypothetical protein
VDGRGWKYCGNGLPLASANSWQSRLEPATRLCSLTGSFLGSWLVAVSHARLGDEPARLGRVRLQLAAQLGHVEPEVACRVAVAGSPDLGEQLALAEQLAGMPEQYL